MKKIVAIIKIKEQKYSYLLDENYLISDIINEIKTSITPNLSYVLYFIWESISNIPNSVSNIQRLDYFLDLSRILLEIDYSNYETIGDLFSSDLIDNGFINTYKINFINNNLVQFASIDYYNGVPEFKAFNYETKGESDVFNDPQYPDLKITIPNVDLNKTFIIANNKIQNTLWHNESAIVIGSRDIFLKSYKLNFMAFSFVSNIINKSFKSFNVMNNFLIPESLQTGYDFFIVIKGHPFFAKERKNYYLIGNKIYINFSFLKNNPLFSGLTINDLINDNNSFICFIECDRLLYNYEYLISNGNNLFISNYADILNDKAYTYTCISSDKYLYDLTMVRELYNNPLDIKRNKINIYIENEAIKTMGKDNNDYYLFQLLIL